MRFAPQAFALLASALLATYGFGTAAAQETILKNDGFVDGQAVGFQGGFVLGEMAGSRLIPAGPFPMRVNRVQFLFGADQSTETITLHIWDDAAGTGAPGTPLFTGDFEVTGSATAMHEVDLIASNILVTGQFRVGIEFQHDGAPSVARDGDGTILSIRNFIYTPSVPGWFQSSLFGLTGDWVIRAGVEPVSAGGNNAPDILTVADVGNDQGKQVRLRFQRSAQDQVGALTPIVQYDVLRRVDPLPVALRAYASMASAPAPSGVLLDGWDYVTSIPAHGDAIYSLVVPTLVDSTIAHGMRRSVFVVRAATIAPLAFYDSAADSGYSVDNLPPVPPVAFAGAYSGGATHLTWDANPDPDLWYYALHRGGTASFIPGPGTLIATAGDPGYDDVGPAGRYYKLAAVDVNGNVSSYALVTPQTTTGVPGAGVPALALASAGPNPSRGGVLQMSVTLPNTAPASLELMDVGGRRVLRHDIGALGVGRHTVDMSVGHRLASGLYLVRLRQENSERVIRVVVTQ